jgi:hypothetical protein
MTETKTPPLTETERELLRAMRGKDLGGFKTALWTAIKRADLSNLDRLKKGFPEEVIAYERWIGESGYAESVKSRATTYD